MTRLRIALLAGLLTITLKYPPVEGRVSTEIRDPQSGNDANSVFMRLTITDLGSTADGQTRCVPGDAAAINRG